ncbi:MAG TPA: penicillin-binding protein 2 [Candidatus Omnitrophota bacterium]|nr:penicillin-binding protein 2 [Candidatus Omnitrophota bacterium]HPS20002.1 penicillin-binding protein 2 [Candidatus Omnitrophota bacterium]
MNEIRLKIFTRILIVMLLFLCSGLFYTQVVKYEIYRHLSEGNRIRVIPLMARRGAIYDRTGRPMVKDELCFEVSVIYSQIKNRPALEAALSEVLNMNVETVHKCIGKSRAKPFSAVSVIPDIGEKGAIQLEEIELAHPGLFVQVSTKRRYLYGPIGANVFGYLGYMGREEYEKLKDFGYQVKDLVGKSGLERYYETYLRGAYGGKQIEVNSSGREIGVLGYKEPVAGKDLYTTIDAELQEYCDNLMADKNGAVVVMDPRNGAILAMVSSPEYDPTVFIERKDPAVIKRLLNDANYPMLNRVVSGTYPPGSVFKLIVAVSALEEGKINDSTCVNCTGSIKVGETEFKCAHIHGTQNLTDAIANSCNMFFYRTGLMVGEDEISKYAKEFGFGEKTGIDLPGEAKGVVPDKEWKKKTYNTGWYKGETVNFSIGQGYLLVTPIQVAKMLSVFANDGYIVKPFLVKKIEDVDMAYQHHPEKIAVSESSIQRVRQGMKNCVNGGGTGVGAKLQDVLVAGKTGTAQTSRGKTHGWFAGFAPYDDARLVVVVFDEYGARSGAYAAELSGMIFQEAKRLGII